MQVHVNTDNHIEGGERLDRYITDVVEEMLAHFRQRITRVEVHLHDENGKKPGVDDKRCVMEARLEGHKPLAASHRGTGVDEVIGEAAQKLRRLI